ncbi:hypothetical protein [uncultured Ruminococcus sp.]|uniref:hypothetical protein n=1 Tax=uncultured Ruminococcus sp. TaxID=165186 RepID=UPI000EC18A69|nr:hypothetical protein [uncultured Ruminococcus sp.]HCJ42412.1 hypothetical protein [Ruminococcus sp.]
MKRSFIITLLLIAVMLCGCTPVSTLEFTCDDMPAGWSMFVLVRPHESDEVIEVSDDDLRNSEIGKFDTDGWCIAERIQHVGAEHNAEMTALYIDGDHDREGFCEKHRKVRIAIVDDKWQVQRVSDEFDIFCEDKYAIVTKAAVNAQSLDISRTKLEKRSYPEGLDSLKILLALGSIGTGLILMVVMAVFLEKKKTPDRVSASATFVALSVCNVLLTVWYLVEELVPYLDIDDSGFTLFDLQALAFFNGFWLVGTALYVLVMRKARAAVGNCPKNSAEC